LVSEEIFFVRGRGGALVLRYPPQRVSLVCESLLIEFGAQDACAHAPRNATATPLCDTLRRVLYHGSLGR